MQRVLLSAALAAVLGFVVCAGSGCGGGYQSVAVGPTEVGPAPREVMFFGPVPAPGPLHELKFEFVRQADSQHAKDLVVVLVTPQGRRDTLRDVTTDRRAESRVSLIGRTQESGATTSYRAVELSCPTPLTVGEVEWRSGS